MRTNHSSSRRRRNNVWKEPSDKKFHSPGNVAAAKYLAGGLIDAGFDTAYSYKPLHHPLGHAFANAVLYLDYDRKGFPYPIIPFAINCYGRKSDRAARRSAGVRESAVGGATRSAGADAAALVRSRRCDRAHLRGESVAGGADGVVGMVACVPHSEK